MNDKKDLATMVADAYDAMLAGINELPPFRWAASAAQWLVDKLCAAIERAMEKEEHMEPWYMRNPEDAKRTETVGADGHLGGISAEEATENIRRNMELLNRPPLPERVREEFHQIFTERVKRDGATELLDWLDRNGFFTAPASTKHHLAIPGGLALHSLNVYHRLREIGAVATLQELEAEDALRKVKAGCGFDLGAGLEESVAIMALLHDVCKTDCYHWDTLINAYKFRDPLPLGHGEKSVYIITRYMKLLETEALAIRWHMGAYDDAVKGGSKAFNEAMRMTPWVWRLHQADMIAAWEDERSGDNGNT